ncbi:retrovirus-related pol polyprotein from transposon TNT 1-94, partial [Tanacetum coccineum]
LYKLDPVTLAPKDKNNMETHIYYLKHTMEQAAILREIVEQAKSLNPLDSASYSACKYDKLIQELLGYVIDTCPNIHKPRVSRSTKSSKSKSTDNTKNDRILQISSSTQKKNKVEDHSRIVKSCLNKPNCVVEPSGNAHVQHSKLNTNSELISKSKSVKKAKKKEELKPTGKVFTKIGYNWRPTGRTFTLVGNACPLTRITATNKVSLKEPIPLEVVAQESVVTKVYTRRPKVVQIVLWYLDSGCSKHMTGDRSQLTNFVHKFLGTVKFGNDQIAKIMRYGDYQIGNITISRVYYVEGLGHNLFSVGQFCDSDLEVAFRKHTCFVRNLEGVDLLSGSRETNLYTLSIGDMMASSPICLLSKASKTKSWLWHRRLSHLNFGAINHLAKNGLVRGLPKLKLKKMIYLSGPMRVASINEKKYILIIGDDYSRFTWVEFLASKLEALDSNLLRKEIRRISAKSSQENAYSQFLILHHKLCAHSKGYTPIRRIVLAQYSVKMDDPNITMEEYMRIKKEKARRRGQVYNWETTTYGKIWCNEDVHDLRSIETEFSAIVLNDALTSEVALSCEPTVSPLNDNQIDFRILFDESDDKDYRVIYDKNLFSYKIISVDDLKTDLENDYDKVNMPSFLSPKPTVSYFNDLGFFKDFENEFPAIVYNDALTSKLDFLTEPAVSPQHIDEFDLKDETSLFECDGEEQNILYIGVSVRMDGVRVQDELKEYNGPRHEIEIQNKCVPYTSLAHLTISRHFQCLRDIINGQIHVDRQSLGEQGDSSDRVLPRLRKMQK